MNSTIIISKDICGNEYKVAVDDLVWRPSAYGIVINLNKILLVKESNKYHLPGGGVNLGEDPLRAVVREVKEETGVDVVNPKLIDSRTSFFTWKSLDKLPVLNHAHSLLLYYSCDHIGGNFSNAKLDDYEIAAGLTAEWVGIDELDKIIVGTTVDWRPIIESFLRESSKLVY